MNGHKKEREAMSINLRIATPSDAVAIAGLGRRAFTAAFGSFNEPENLQTHLASNHTPEIVAAEFANGSTYIIAEVDSRAAGFGKLRIHGSPECIPGSNPGEVQQLFLLPEFHRMGIGRRLLDELKRLAQQNGGDGLFLSTWAKADWAISFYESCGFRKVGEQIFRVGADDQTDWLMYIEMP